MNHPSKANHRYRLRSSSRRILRSTVGGNKKVANETGSKLKGVVKKGGTKEKKRGSKEKKRGVKEKKRAAKKTQGDQAACFPDPTWEPIYCQWNKKRVIAWEGPRIKGKQDLPDGWISALVDKGYERRYLVRWKGWGRKHDEWHGLNDLKNATESVNAFDNKHPRSREPPKRKAQAKPRIASPDLLLASDDGSPLKRRRLTRNRTVGNGVRDM